MTNRRFTLLTFAAVALATFLAPASAGAQTVWERIRDRASQERDRNERDRDPDWRRDQRNDDRYGRRGGRMSDSERRQLRDLARRIDDRSRDLQRDVDHLLDNSRYDGSRREDHINDDARTFRDAASRFRNVAGDNNDLYGSTDEARNLLDRASHVGQMLNRVRADSRTWSDWNQLRSDLRTVANIYGLRFNDNGGYNGNNNDDWRRNGRNGGGYSYPE
ncbi:MAG: hypothetical protein QOJ70_2914 [Acidobacteriota bacterium]|jgi:uncharacterized membrane protein|nr:hypothetical protein [Acidobacteriota bacterium]